MLPSTYFYSANVVELARDLIGKILCTSFDGQITKGIIVETEAYRAPEDKASHAYGNRRTARTNTMFLAGGRSYVYLCYGIHHLFNIVTGPENLAHAILVRAIEPFEGIEIMLERRKMKNLSTRLTAGPGILTKALGIHTGHDNQVLNPASDLWIEDQNLKIASSQIISSPRVGVQYAEECAAWPWRFRLKANKWCSPAK